MPFPWVPLFDCEICDLGSFPQKTIETLFPLGETFAFLTNAHNLAVILFQ